MLLEKIQQHLCLTNPNTLGLFEENILEMAKMVHDAGGKLYYDGANLNAVLSKARPGDMGFDVVHLNLHKTFTGPHGGGGPGSGPVGVKADLIPFLPKPIVTKKNDEFVLIMIDHNRLVVLNLITETLVLMFVLIRIFVLWDLMA